MNVANLDILHLQISQNPGTLQIFLFDSVQTVLMLRFDLAFQNYLVYGTAQSQIRKKPVMANCGVNGFPPPGNIYACIRLHLLWGIQNRSGNSIFGAVMRSRVKITLAGQFY